MARKMTEWPSKRGPITKIMPSDGCIGDTVPWRWESGTISTNLDGIWGMSVEGTARMPIYEKPTRELMHEFAAQELKPGQVFSRKDAVRWFADHYPDIKSNTVEMHVDGMSVNASRRRHSPSIRPDAGWDLFFKLSSREFRLWDPEKDPAPRYKADIEAGIAKGVAETDDFAEETTEEDDLGSRKFAFERDLQNYLVQNLGLLEPGLKLYEDEIKS